MKAKSLSGVKNTVILLVSSPNEACAYAYITSIADV